MANCRTNNFWNTATSLNNNLYVNFLTCKLTLLIYTYICTLYWNGTNVCGYSTVIAFKTCLQIIKNLCGLSMFFSNMLGYQVWSTKINEFPTFSAIQIKLLYKIKLAMLTIYRKHLFTCSRVWIGRASKVAKLCCK